MNTFAHRYGFGGYLLRDKEKNKGVSTVTGALVVNRQAQPVGLISSRKLFGSYDPSDKNKNGFVNVFDNFQQLQDITVDYKTTNEDLKPPFAKTAVTKNYLRYNLIDNSKTKELGQKNSYRKALNDLYPDGIFYGIFKTSLFDDYRF